MAVSSSPGLPSPSFLFGRGRSNLRNGSHTVQLPEGALRGFKTAAALVREQTLGLQRVEDLNTTRSIPNSESKLLHDEIIQKPAKRQQTATVKADGGSGPRKRRRRGEQDEAEAKEKEPTITGIAPKGSTLESGVEVCMDVRKPQPHTDKALAREAGNDAASGPVVTVDERPVKPRKSRCKKVKAVDSIAESIATENCPEADSAPAIKSRKPRVRKDKTVNDKAPKQAKIAKGQVMKPGAQPKDAVRKLNALPDEQATSVVSEYFVKPSNPNVDSIRELEPAKQETTLDLHPALPRKVTWTQVKDTHPRTAGEIHGQSTGLESEGHVNTEVVADDSTNPKAELGPLSNKSFANLISNFGYEARMAALDAMPIMRTVGSEGTTKRRRLEMIESNVPQLPTAVRKKPKSPKKKPRTVTEAATAAYRLPDIENTTVEPSAVVEAFFAPRKPATATCVLDCVAADGAAADGQPQRKRKSRAKPAVDGEKRVKKTSVKIKGKAAPALPKLLSPGTAMRKMDKQDILFGTSSQLAREESPSLIRELQRAMQESEAILIMDEETGSLQSKRPVLQSNSGKCTSRLTASKGLWSAAARDFNNQLVSAEPFTATKVDLESVAMQDAELSEFHDVNDIAPTREINASDAEEFVAPAKVASTGDSNIVLEASAVGAGMTAGGGVANTASQHVDYTPFQATDDLKSFGLEQLTQENSTVTNGARSRDSDTSCADINGRLSAVPTAMSKLFDELDVEFEDIDDIPNSKVLAKEKSATADAVIKRLPLQRLSSNLNPNVPRATCEVTKPAANAPLSSTRLSKEVQAPERMSLHSTSTSIPPTKRPRGRPRKIPVPDSEPALLTSKLPRKPKALVTESLPAPSTPSMRVKTTGKGWLSIDEIEDSEPEPTSSPPRRRSLTSTPPLALRMSSPLPAQRFLQASAQVPDCDHHAPADPPKKASRASKLARTRMTKAELELLKEGLFKDITAAVMACDRTTDPTKPSWWEKILMYDPIVLEDLTAWLKLQGVRVCRPVDVSSAVDVDGESGNGTANWGTAAEAAGKQRKKAKGKAKSVKEGRVRDEAAEEGEMLKEWMVQKWCEQKSICCLWREGLRGGVKSRY